MQLGFLALAVGLLTWRATADSCSSILNDQNCTATGICGWCSPQDAYVSGTSCCLTLPANLLPGQKVSCSCSTSVNLFAVIMTIACAVAFCVCVAFLARRFCCRGYRYGYAGAVGYQQFQPVHAVPVQGVPYQQTVPGQYIAQQQQQQQQQQPSYYAPAGQQGYYEAQPTPAKPSANADSV